MATAEFRPLQTFWHRNPVHAKMPEFVPRGVPSHQIPQRGQDQHGLRFDLTGGPLSDLVAVMEPQGRLAQEGGFEGGQKARIDHSKIGQILIGQALTHMQAVQKPPQILQFVARQGFFDLGQTGIGQPAKGQVPRRPHRRDADQQGKDLGHRQPRRGLDRGRVQPQSPPASRLAVDDETLFAKIPQIAQHRAARGPDLRRQLIHRHRAHAAQMSGDGLLAVANVHLRLVQSFSARNWHHLTLGRPMQSAQEEQAMKRTQVNPWDWSMKFGFSQGELIEGAKQQLICAGQTSVDAAGLPLHPGDMRGQIGQSLDNLMAVLSGAGMGAANVVRLVVYATDMDQVLQNFDLVAARFGAAKIAPPMTLVGVARLAIPSLMVEIEATAMD